MAGSTDYEARLIEAQREIDAAKRMVTTLVNRRAKLEREAIEDGGLTIYRVAQILGLNRRVVEKDLAKGF